MKHTTLLALLMGLHLTASAQWVTIPDPFFAGRLIELFPDCMNEELLDTSCPEVITATMLDLISAGITDLTGIEYFVNLDSLYCADNFLMEMPEMPATLTYLDCGLNMLSELPTLPPGLTTLICAANMLEALPALPPTLTWLEASFNSLAELPVLPASLAVLSCRGNSLVALPALPGALLELDCGANALAALPSLPANMSILMCDVNELTSLPALPAALTLLNCMDNALTALPSLPAALTELGCDNNPLAALPTLPASLVLLGCGGNGLTALPPLPDGLQYLLCASNALVTLPQLPEGLLGLTCQNNLLTCLPTLPNSLVSSWVVTFNISDNPFTCLPNTVPAMSGPSAYWLDFPICDLTDLDNNPYGCTGFAGIVGKVFDDVNGNCMQDAGEPGLVGVSLKLLDAQGELLAMTTSQADGHYHFVAEAGEYTVLLVTADMAYMPSCTMPGDAQEVVLSAADPTGAGVDFGVTCQPGFDVGVASVAATGWVFPFQTHTLHIIAGDLISAYGLQCAAGIGGTVTVDVDGPVEYLQPAPGALTPTITGAMQFTYTIPDFATVNNQQDFRLVMRADSTAAAGDTVCVTVTVAPMAGDINPGNNSLTYCYDVVNSYDPNVKRVWPVDVPPGYVDPFTYTIFFQNTGNAPAFNIRIADTLDSNLDLNSFMVTGYSHPVLTYLSGSLLTFRFNNIMLPDSTSDPEGSIGYVQYRIKPLPGLPVGTLIENTAHIFFDFNEAIVTNTTQNLFATTTGVAEVPVLGVQVFPNPGSGQYQVLLRGAEAGGTWMVVYDAAGRRVLEQRAVGALSVLDLTTKPAGLYLLRVWNAQGSGVVRVVKQ
ncbi:MAG: T9SS type A sorting domain-containing protein [Flavobacteriales bacterium]|nr:T9SS type A sorting domain-containing protein [Flavobacteriales bacterium]